MFLTRSHCKICGKIIKKHERNVHITLRRGQGFFGEDRHATTSIHLRCIENGKYQGYSKDEAVDVINRMMEGVGQ